MAELKSHVPAPSELVSDSDRSESGAGIIVLILAVLLLVGLLAGGGVAGFVVYLRYARQLAMERARVMEIADMERAQAELAAKNAEQRAELAAAQARFAELATPGTLEPGLDPPDAMLASPTPQPTPEQRFEAEIEPLNQAVEERPEDPKVYLNRARAFQRWRKWQQAAEDYDRFLQINPNNAWVRMDAAVTCLANGNREGYLTHCKVVVERLALRPYPTNEHNRAARVLSLAPGALADGDKLLVMAQDEPLKNPGKWWLLEPMLALQYRLGRYDEAAKTIAELRPLAAFSGQQAATEIWAAMTFHQLGRIDEARQSLASAKEIVATGLMPPGLTNAGGDAVIESLVLLEEAKSLLEG
jgi:tetratricopeptide (TPR) repeat protein